MLSALRRRAQKAGLLDRIELRHIRDDGLGVKDISGKVDFAVVIYGYFEANGEMGNGGLNTLSI